MSVQSIAKIATYIILQNVARGNSVGWLLGRWHYWRVPERDSCQPWMFRGLTYTHQKDDRCRYDFNEIPLVVTRKCKNHRIENTQKLNVFARVCSGLRACLYKYELPLQMLSTMYHFVFTSKQWLIVNNERFIDNCNCCFRISQNILNLYFRIDDCINHF